MGNIWLVIVGVIGLVLAAFIRPERAVCPKGWYVEGVRRAGDTQCRPEIPDDPRDWPGDDPRDTVHRDLKPYNAELPMQIYCTGGSQPIVVNDRTVGCQMGARYQE